MPLLFNPTHIFQDTKSQQKVQIVRYTAHQQKASSSEEESESSDIEEEIVTQTQQQFIVLILLGTLGEIAQLKINKDALHRSFPLTVTDIIQQNFLSLAEVFGQEKQFLNDNKLTVSAQEYDNFILVSFSNILVLFDKNLFSIKFVFTVSDLLDVQIKAEDFSTTTVTKKQIDQLIISSFNNRYISFRCEETIFFLDPKNRQQQLLLKLKFDENEHEMIVRRTILLENQLVLFADNKYLYLELRSATISRVQKYPSWVLPVDNCLVEAFYLQPRTDGDKLQFLILHENSLLIMVDNEQYQYRYGPGKLTTIRIPNRRVDYVDPFATEIVGINDTKLIQLFVERHYMSGLVQTDETLLFRNMKSFDSMQFFIQKTQLGEQLRLVDLADQKKQIVYPIPNSTLATVNAHNLRKGKKELMKAKLQFDNDGSDDNYVLDYSISNDLVQLAVVGSHVTGIYGVSGILISVIRQVASKFVGYVNLQHDQYLQEALKADLYPGVSIHQSKLIFILTEQEIKIFNTQNGLHAGTVAFNSSQYEQFQWFGHQDMLCCMSRGVLDIFKLIVTNKSIYLQIMRKCVFDNKIFIQQNELVLSENVLYFCCDKTIYEYNIKQNILYLLQKFDNTIASFDFLNQVFAISFVGVTGVTTYILDEFAVKVPIGQQFVSETGIAKIESESKGSLLLNHLKQSQGMQFRSHTTKMFKKKRDFGMTDFASLPFITERDLLFCDAQELLLVLKHAYDTGDQLYYVLVMYLVTKYKVDEVKSDQLLVDAIKSGIEASRKQLGQIQEVQEYLHALLSFA